MGTSLVGEADQGGSGNQGQAATASGRRAGSGMVSDGAGWRRPRTRAARPGRINDSGGASMPMTSTKAELTTSSVAAARTSRSKYLRTTRSASDDEPPVVAG